MKLSSDLYVCAMGHRPTYIWMHFIHNKIIKTLCLVFNLCVCLCVYEY